MLQRFEKDLIMGYTSCFLSIYIRFVFAYIIEKIIIIIVTIKNVDKIFYVASNTFSFKQSYSLDVKLYMYKYQLIQRNTNKTQKKNF